MKSLSRRLLLTVAAVALSGCFPEERFWWSPAGDRALVSINDQLHVVTTEGALGTALPELSMEGALVKTVSWLPDGSGFVCQRVRRLASWEQTLALIPAEEATAVDQFVPVVLPLLEAATKIAKNADSLESILQVLPSGERLRFHVAFQRAWQQDPAGMERLLTALPQGAEIVAETKKKGAGYDLSELCLFKLDAKGGGAGAPVSLSRSLLMPSVIPKASPKHPYVACLKLSEKQEAATLEVLPLEGGPAMVIARNVAGAFDWLPDGRTLVFMAPIGGGDGEKLQSIHRITVVQENGALMKPSYETQADGSSVRIKASDRLAEPVTLATAIMLNRPALQALPDGRVLFASQPATLPAAGTGPGLEPRLYVIAADGQSVKAVPTAPGDLPTNLGYFVVSPDGKHIAVVESDTDALAVVETNSGKTQIISSPHPGWQCETIPAWKSATDLSFAALGSDAKTPQWMMWSASAGVRSLSATWPAATTAKWLQHKEQK